jgi:hypothetical protein
MRAKMMLSTTSLLLIAAAGGAVLRETSKASATVAEDAFPERHLYVDVHELGPGQVTAEAVAEAHQKDLANQDQFDTQFLKYWVDEAQGRVYCLSSAPSADAVVQTHRAAHGLLPASVHPVSPGDEAPITGQGRLFLDVHRLGPGQVTASAVAEAHEADLQTQDRYGVNFLEYWVDEGEGVIWCLAEAPDADAMQETHREAHGLVADETMEVVQGE